MKLQKGFTLIELMVVIVIIGILSALAVPKMFGTSAKAKAAEAPGIIANWETLQSAHVHEQTTAGGFTEIGFVDPTGTSKFFRYDDGGPSAVSTTITAATIVAFGDCALGDNFISTHTVSTNNSDHTAPLIGTCAASYTPNFFP